MIWSNLSDPYFCLLMDDTIMMEILEGRGSDMKEAKITRKLITKSNQTVNGAVLH